MRRLLISYFLYFTGAGFVWRWLNRYKISVLTIHSILDTAKPHDWLPLKSYLDVETFYRNLIFLKKHFNFIDFDHACKIIRGDVPPVPYALVVTFDDGYLNNFTEALPVLEKLGIPGTFFVVSEFLSAHKPFWFDRMDYALQHNVEGVKTLPVCGEEVVIDGRSRVTLKASLRNVFRILMSNRPNDTEIEQDAEPLCRLIESLRGKSLLDNYTKTSPCYVATREDIKAAAQSELVTIGSHTVVHARLTGLNEGQLMQQLTLSKQAIEELTQEPCRFFCYPNGSYDEKSVLAVNQAGYEAAVTSDEGLLKLGNSNLWTLKRVNWPSNVGPIEMFAISLGVFK